MSDFLIRDAQERDYPSILSLVKDLAAADAEKYPLDLSYVGFYLHQTGQHVLVADQAGQVLGMISYSIRPNLYHAGPTCLVEELIVDERQRGRGIGGALLDAAILRARQGGCAEISITTMSDNLFAIEFYRRHGFSEEGVYLEMHFRE